MFFPPIYHAKYSFFLKNNYIIYLSYLQLELLSSRNIEYYYLCLFFYGLLFVLIFVRKMNFFHLIYRRFKYIKHLSKSAMALLTYSASIAYHYYNNQHSASHPTAFSPSHLRYSYNPQTNPHHTSSH